MKLFLEILKNDEIMNIIRDINYLRAHRGIAIFVAMLLCANFSYARKVIQTSDNTRPHWCERVDNIFRYNATYEYKCVVNSGMNISPLRTDRIQSLKDYYQQEYKIEGNADIEYLHHNENGNIQQTDSYKLKFHTKSSVQEFECIFIDEYWERYDDGEYRLFSLYAVSIPNIKPQFDTYTLSTHYKPSEGLVRSLIPGWGQIYKGSKIKGGLIIVGEALGIGGIVTCYSMKSSYEKLIKEDSKHAKDYSLSADMWQNIGYGCIAFTAAVYIYNLIDAAVAPGARRVIVLPRQQSITLAPSISYDGSVGVAMRYKF